MNHLAHAYLAGDTPESIIGNLSGDFVRGPVDDQFEFGVANGIRLHRHVDSFTDSHAIPRRSRKRFVGAQRRVAGIVVDVYYDHFLSRHWELFAAETLPVFCNRVYAVLRFHQATAPVNFRVFIPRFVEYDLLNSCITLEGVDRVIERLAIRWQQKPQLQSLLLRAGAEARNHCDGLQDDFLAFFPQLIREVDEFSRARQRVVQQN